MQWVTFLYPNFIASKILIQNIFTLGILLFAYGGMDMAQGLGWNISTDLPTTSEMQYSWFIGVIIGAFVAGLSITHIPKKVFYVSRLQISYKLNK